MSTALDNTTTKKRKNSDRATDADRVSHKKSKKSGKDKHEKHDRKGKKRDTQGEGEFKKVSASISLSIPPIFAKNYMAGAFEMLDSLIMQYVSVFLFRVS